MTQSENQPAILIQAALLAYCLNHVPRSPDDYGLTCDERGCDICNAGPEDAAQWRYDAWRGRGDPEFPPPPLPFDPTNRDELLEMIGEYDYEGTDV